MTRMGDFGRFPEIQQAIDNQESPEDCPQPPPDDDITEALQRLEERKRHG